MTTDPRAWIAEAADAADMAARKDVTEHTRMQAAGDVHLDYMPRMAAALTAVLDVLENGAWEQEVHDLAPDVIVVGVDDVYRAITDNLPGGNHG